MTVVFPNHFQVLVTQEFSQVFQLVGMLPDEIGRKRVPQSVDAETRGPLELLGLNELVHHVVEVDLQGVRVPRFSVPVQEDRTIGMFGVQFQYQLPSLLWEPDSLYPLPRIAFVKVGHIPCSRLWVVVLGGHLAHEIRTAPCPAQNTNHVAEGGIGVLKHLLVDLLRPNSLPTTASAFWQLQPALEGIARDQSAASFFLRLRS